MPSNLASSFKNPCLSLRHDDARRLHIVFGQTDRGDHRRADAEHKPDARGEQEHRRHDVDGSQSVGADAVAYEHTVADVEDRVEEHRDQRGKEHGTEKSSDFLVAKVKTVSIHNESHDEINKPGFNEMSSEVSGAKIVCHYGYFILYMP